MKKIIIIILSIFFVVAVVLWFWKISGRDARFPEGNWTEDFSDNFNRSSLGDGWVIPDSTKVSSRIGLSEKIEIKDSSLYIENPLYSPYSEIWLEKKYEGPVRIEFDLKINLKRGGEFGVRLAHSQREILPNTPGYEVYLVSLTTGVIKRADRDEQVNAQIRLPKEVLKGEKPFHVIIEKTFRKVRLGIEKKLVLEFPDPEILSGNRFAFCGFFLNAGEVVIKNLKVSVSPKGEISDLLTRAYEFYTSGDYKEALSLYERFLKDEPNHKRALESKFRKALCYKYLKNYNESVTLLNGLMFNVADKEFVPDALFFLGEIYLEFKEYQKAEKYFSGFISRFKKHPYVPKAYEKVAFCQWYGGQYKDVLETTEKLLKKFPSSSPAIHSHYLRGQVFETLNEKEKAINEYTTLLRLVQKDRIANLTRDALRKLKSETGDETAKIEWGRNSVEIVYLPTTESPLKNSKEIFIHWGRNGWQQVQDTRMTKTENGWKVAIPLKKEIRSIEFVFTDGQGNWDNNDGLNWEEVSPRL